LRISPKSIVRPGIPPLAVPCENHRRSTVDLLQHPQVLQETKADFQERMKDRKYTTKIPKGEKAPRAIG